MLVGTGQVTHRSGDAPEPVALLAEAARRTASGPAGRRLLASVDSVRVVRIVSRRYPDPAALVAEQLGCEPKETVYSTGGGQLPQLLIANAAEEIRRGYVGAVLVGGAESWRTRRALKRRGETAPWTTQSPDAAPSRIEGPALDMTDENEAALGMLDPVQVYPLFETALRARLGLTPDDHLARMSRLWARFSEVAAENPHAVLPTARSATDIGTVTPDNRLIGFPYRKLMVANDDVDQAAALLLCSAERAAAAGVPRDEWVFLHGVGMAHDTPYVSNRHDLARSPAIAVAGHDALAQAGIGVDDLGHVDLYSCFPSAVQIAAEELGIGLDRSLTVTGGLTFAGGPWHNYVSHSVATMAERLRADPSAYGLCTANGGMLTKHAVAVYSCRPPGDRGPLAAPPKQAGAGRPSVPFHQGPATVEAYTVMHDRDGVPSQAFVACLTPNGSRAVVATDEPSMLRSFLDTDPCGTTVHVSGRRLVG